MPSFEVNRRYRRCTKVLVFLFSFHDQEFLEHIMQEVLQRGVAFVGLRAEQGSFPTTEHKGGERLGPGGLWQISLLHGLDQHRGNSDLPARETRAEAALQ